MLVSHDGEQGALVLRGALSGSVFSSAASRDGKAESHADVFLDIDERRGEQVLLARDKLKLVNHGASMQAGVLPFAVHGHSIWMSRRVHVTPVRCERVLQSVAEKLVQKIFVYFQSSLDTLMGKTVEIQQVLRVNLSKFRILGCIPVHPGRRCTVPDKP